MVEVTELISCNAADGGEGQKPQQQEREQPEAPADTLRTHAAFGFCERSAGRKGAVGSKALRQGVPLMRTESVERIPNVKNKSRDTANGYVRQNKRRRTGLSSNLTTKQYLSHRNFNIFGRAWQGVWITKPRR
jgi:hypothetical protein